MDRDGYKISRGGGGGVAGKGAAAKGGYEGSRGGRAGGRAPGMGMPSGAWSREPAGHPVASPLPGEVWRVVDASGAASLLWHLPQGALDEPSAQKAIARAGTLSAGLRHDHLRTCLEFRDGTLRLHEFDEAQVTSEAWLKGFSGGRATPEVAFPVIRDVAEALDHVANNGAVPQNLGPGSITILPEGNDGAPAGLLEEFVVADAVRAALRKAGAKGGAWTEAAGWRAPECRGGATATAAANQWILAAMLYWMLSGRMPDATSFKPLRQLKAGQNKAFRRALSPDPGQRFRCCADFAQMAETGLNPDAPRRLMGFLAAGIIALGVGLAVWYVWSIRAKGPDVRSLPPGGGELEEIPIKTLSPEAEAQLVNALDARKKGQWKDCLKAARLVLAEAPEHVQAKALATEAEDELRPWVEIEADKPGAWIVHGDEKVRLPTRIRVEPGGRAGPWDVVADIGGERWSGFIPEFDVGEDWSGTRKRSVRLQRGEVGAGAERKRRTVTFPDGNEITMIWCPPGTFRMGEKGSGNERDVRLTKGFWLAETELTVGEWKSVKGRSPSSLAKWNNSFKRPPIQDINARPLENVSWEEADAFLGDLNAGGYELDLHFRLPTEAEWEYACRAGTDGDFAGTAEDMAWFEKTAKTVSVTDNNTNVRISERVAPQPPRQKKANAWGFFDMHGNVAEWCADYWTERPWERMPREGETADPAVLSGGMRGEGHVVRGGNVRSHAADCASHARRQVAESGQGERGGFAGVLDSISKMQGGEDRHYENIGFRLAADEN